MKSSPRIIALILCIHFYGISGTRIAMYDRTAGGMAKFYLDKTNAACTSSGPNTFFTSFSNKDRKQLCINSIMSIGFEWVSEGENYIKLPNLKDAIKKSIKDINRYYNDRPAASVPVDDDITMPVKLGEEVKEITGIICSHEPHLLFAVEDGCDKNQFFLIGRTPAISEKPGLLLGIVEEITTTIDQAIRYSQEKLEKSFLLSQRSLNNQFLNIGNMDKINKLRACSSVFIVWAANAVDVNKRYIVQKDVGNHEIIQISSIQFSSRAAADSNFQSLFLMNNTIDVIRCDINTIDASNPPFYLTTDKLKPRAVFVLTHFSEQDAVKYKIDMRVENVLGLETLPYYTG